MGNVFETCSLSKKASRNISEPESLDDIGRKEKMIEPEAPLETYTGKFTYIPAWYHCAMVNRQRQVNPVSLVP